MADRISEKKQTRTDDYKIPIVTPDRRRSHQEFNPRGDYKANIKWNNPYSLLGQTDQPTKRATPNKTEETRSETKRSETKNQRRNMTDDDEKTYTGTAKVLKEEMQWDNKANKTPTILEVLEFKADLIEGLRLCTYRGNKQGHTYLIETEEELRERTKDETAEVTVRPKAPKEPTEPTDMEDDKLWDRYDRMERLYKKNVRRYELAEDYDKQIKKLLIEAFPGCENYHLEGGTHLPDHITGETILTTLMDRAKLSEASRNCGRVIYNRFGDGPAGHKYIPNANGPSSFFQAIDKDLKLAKELEEDIITYKVAIKKANEAFWKCGHEKNDLNRLELAWGVEATKYTDDKERYEAYKTYYNKELTKLFIYKPIEQHHKAFNMDTIEAMMDNKMEEHIDNYNEIATAYETAMQSQAIQNKARTNDIPATIIADTAATSGLTSSKHTALETKVNEHDSKLDSILELLRNQTKTNHDNTYKDRSNTTEKRYQRGPKRWIQMDRYCWSHGVCNHTSERCKFPEKNHKKDATFQNKKGGCTTGSNRWMKWLSPKGEVHESKGSE